MCLVSYVPLKAGFVLSSNRDESPQRSADRIENTTIGSKTIYFPTDSAGGSWIFNSDSGDAICLLNGAFNNHIRTLPYRMSRGLVMKAYFKYDNAIDFLQYFDFWNIEPFTMVIITDQYFFEFRWDGNSKHIQELNKESSHIWSSCTLYDTEHQNNREAIFRSKLEEIDIPSPELIKAIHLIKTDDLMNGFVMNRSDIVATISITQIIHQDEKTHMIHQNLLDGTVISR